jgi:hypothetical protein
MDIVDDDEEHFYITYHSDNVTIYIDPIFYSEENSKQFEAVSYSKTLNFKSSSEFWLYDISFFLEEVKTHLVFS